MVSSYYRKQWLERGLCGQCGGRPPISSRNYCQKCVDASRKSVKKRRVHHNEIGLCSYCGKRPPESGRKRCAKCRAAQQKCYHNRLAAGLCTSCGEPATAGFGRCEKHRKISSDQAKQYRNRCRLIVIERYSNGTNRCACCGETIIDFLTIDHINGGGRKHCREVTGGFSSSKFYQWLEKQGFPDGFQVLCWNCNCGRAKNGGICPHHSSSSSSSNIIIRSGNSCTS